MTVFGLKLQGQDQENRAAHPNQELQRRTTLYGFLGSQARFCDTRISSIILKRHRGFYEASKRMTNKKIDAESALYYNVRLPNLKSIYNNIWQKTPFRIGYFLKPLRFLSILVFFFSFFFTDICIRACISQSSTLYSQLLRQLVASESAFLHVNDVKPALLVLFPKPIDLPPSKPLISLVTMTSTTNCFQGQGIVMSPSLLFSQPITQASLLHAADAFWITWSEQGFECWILHRNALTKKAQEDAEQGLGKPIP